ncbi:MAG: type II secretion system F family protein [Phycisphaerae bacterium]|nr:type II secretion system F family protein [Phycisphaerae bacterium]NUQ44909.1 type II secretion system F family protein [Phycisphaerae bacterium]
MDPIQLVSIGLIGVIGALVAGAIVRRGGSPVGKELDRRLTDRATPEDAPQVAGGLDKRREPGRFAELARKITKPLEGSEYARNQLAMKLAQAGYRGERAVAVFLATKLILAGLGFVGGWFLHRAIGSQPAKTHEVIAYVLMVGGFGFFLPQVWLGARASSRALKISNGLADSLDMIVVMVEAGLGLDAAIQRCADEIQIAHPEIADEWRLAARETQMGLTRGEALRKMAERTGVEEMSTLVAILTQAERFGTSIATALRVQADVMRTKRHQKAEEAAAKVAVKMIFPLVLFIFPTIFIVLAGPAAMRIGKAFGK